MQFLRETATSTRTLLGLGGVLSSRLRYPGYSAELGTEFSVMTLGKYLGGGMTYGAFGGHKDIISLFDSSTKGLLYLRTYNNHVVNMSASIAGVNLCSEAEFDRLQTAN